MKRFYILSGLISVLLLLSTIGTAQNSKELSKAQDHVSSASEVLDEVMKISDKAIPQEILDKAQAVVVFPGVVKAAFVFGGQGGKGVVVRRTANGWSAPAFLSMGGGSFGAQIGGQKTDYVMIVTNDDGLKSLLQDKFEMGGEASVAAGPVGRTAAASTSATLGAGILTYSRSKGAFAGVSLKGVVISGDNDLNEAIYHKTAKELMIDSPVGWADAPDSLQLFPKTVAGFSK